MALESAGTSIFVACSRCATRTQHIVLEHVERSGREGYEHDFYAWEDDYQIIECRGCRTVSFRHLHSNSEDCTGPDGECRVSQELYPARIEGRRDLMDLIFVPHDVREVYQETLAAMANNQPVLAGIGIRAIVETVCREMEAEGRSLKQKIDDLASRGLLTTDGAKILHRLRTMGNRSAHAVIPHTSAQLALSMDVVEHLLQGAFIFPERVHWTLEEEA